MAENRAVSIKNIIRASSELKTEREVDLHFNLIEILADEVKKIQFLKELFHYQIRIE